MTNWHDALATIAFDVEKHFDQLKYQLINRLGGRDPVIITPYLGYGTRRHVYLRGRVLEYQGISSAVDNDSLWDNLTDMYRRLESDEVRHPRLRARCAGTEEEILGNEEGMFTVRLDLDAPLPRGRSWHDVELELLDPEPPAQETVRATGRVFVPPADAQFVVISDIDDTVIETHATELLRMARTVFLGNARTRLPFPGVAAFYRALHDGRNPLFYVSSSPWNLYDMFIDFFELQNIPQMPIFLRNWGISRHEILPTHHVAHKLGIINEMLDFYPDLPFILIGDSGQEDPEIYQQVVERYPGRVQAVFIRNVTDDPERPQAIRALARDVEQAGSILILADDTLVMAEYAAAQGWIDADALSAIATEVEADQAPPSALEEMLGAPETAAASAVVVESGAEEAVREPAAHADDAEEALAIDEETDQPATIIIDGEESADE